MTAITPFLMFQGYAEEAVSLYVSLFADSEIQEVRHYGPDGSAGKEGEAALIRFTLAGREVRALDSVVMHSFSFTPSFSFFVDCASEAELDSAFASLSHMGQVLMPAAAYPFAKKFAWVQDRFGVSWQLSFN
jgi:predicted 3-demethylubiquinone-9 3-methyltransferase (glyoxalase superfamily)